MLVNPSEQKPRPDPRRFESFLQRRSLSRAFAGNPVSRVLLAWSHPTNANFPCALPCPSPSPSYNACARLAASLGRGILDPKPIGRNIPMTLHPPLEISVRESNGVYFVAVHGRLTIGDPSDHLNDQAVAMLKKGARNIIIDLNGIPQIDSSGFCSLVRISIALAREGGALHLVCGQGRVRDALTVTRLVEAIPTFDSESAALASFT